MYDVIIVGAGHNGLVCAAYLAQKGKRVKIFERSSVVGGAAITEEFHPGFRNSVASYTVSLLNPKVIEDMKLHDFGLRVIDRPAPNFLPIDRERSLQMYSTLEETQEEVRKFSERDAQTLPKYYEMLEVVADVLRELVLKTPVEMKGSLGNIVNGLKTANMFRKLTEHQRQDVVDLFTKSAHEVLDQWFESDYIKAVFAFDSVVGNYASPDTPGSAYVLLHHVFGEVNGKKGSWGHAVGGMGAITQAMARSVKALGVDIELEAPVAKVIVENGAAKGVLLEDGRECFAPMVAANINPKLLYTKLVDAHHLEDNFLRKMTAYRCGSATFRMNVALSELPDFLCKPGAHEQLHHRSGIIMAPTMKYMQRAFFDAKERGWSRKPIVEMLIPSTVDDTLAPKGQHVASLFCQHFDYDLPHDISWDDVKQAAVADIFSTIDSFAPNFSKSVIATQILSPLDLERKFGLVNGDIMHGSLGLDQLYSNRPLMGYGAYRSPIKGLFMCGSGTHPGGGVTGAPGHNCAREMAKA